MREIVSLVAVSAPRARPTSSRSALANDLPVHTANPDDFSGIDGLEVIAVPVPG